MRRFRISIAGMMLLVAVVALGVMGLREGTELWASATFTLTVVILLGAILSAVHGHGSRRAFWGGFVLFGWIYLLWIFRPGAYTNQELDVPPLLPSVLLDVVDEHIHPAPQYIPDPNYRGGTPAMMPMAPSFMVTVGTPPGTPMIIKPGTVPWAGDITNYQQVGHCLAALLFGLLGGAWSGYAHARHGRVDEGSAP
jgi:hypothetical protein